MILEPIPESEIGEYRNLLRGQTVYGVFRRQDLPPGVLQWMQDRRPAELLRIKKSRRWCSLPHGCPQTGFRWEVVFDFGPYKSTYNGPHDLPGGTQCDICHTWCRYGHFLVHPAWKAAELVVGRDCAVLLSDLDPAWAEKKLAQEVRRRMRARRLAQIEEENRRLTEEAERRREAAFRLGQEAAAQQAADNIAAAMLQDYGQRGRPREERLVSCISNVSPAQMPSDLPWRQWCATVRQRAAFDLREAISSAAYSSHQGNTTFRVIVAGIDVSGTVYPKGGGWRYVWRLPSAVEYSKCQFQSRAKAYEALVAHLERALPQYAESEHAKQAYLASTLRAAI